MAKKLYHESFQCGPDGLEICVRDLKYQGPIAIYLWLILIMASWTLLPWWIFWALLPIVSGFSLILGSEIEEWLGVDRGILRVSGGRLELLNLGIPRFLPISLGKDLGSVRTLACRPSLDWEPEYGFSWESQLDLGPVVLAGWGESIVLSKALSDIPEEMSAAWQGERTLALRRLLELYTGLSCLDLPPSDEAYHASQASRDLLA